MHNSLNQSLVENTFWNRVFSIGYAVSCFFDENHIKIGLITKLNTAKLSITDYSNTGIFYAPALWFTVFLSIKFPGNDNKLFDKGFSKPG